jgi:hypothetical protein
LATSLVCWFCFDALYLVDSLLSIGDQLPAQEHIPTKGGFECRKASILKHNVVLMMKNRSFDHMLGGLKKKNPQIAGLDGTESNPDTSGAAVTVQPNALFQGQLDHDPDHHFPGVDLQIFGGDMSSTRKPLMP